MMNRRYWIKEIMVTGTGLVLLPSCLQNDRKTSTVLKNIGVNDTDEILLANVVDTIIPASDTRGAKELNVHLFILKMVDDCYEKNDQSLFISGLKKFNDYCKQKTANSFEKNNTETKLALFAGIASNHSSEKEIYYFLNSTRQLTILGYTQSEYIMTEIKPYKLVPYHFDGCVKINKTI